MQPFLKLHPFIQSYSWGTKDFIPQLLHQENLLDEPQAELWLGTHPNGMTTCGESALSLSDILQKDSQYYLGEAVNELPFLFKVLSVASPLSLQVHPTKEQAKEGFQRENKARISTHSLRRNYKDANEKPEIIVALTTYYGLSGFLPKNSIADNLAPLAMSDSLKKLFEPNDLVDEVWLKSFFSALINLTQGERTTLIKSALEYHNGESVDDKRDYRYWLQRLCSLYPENPTALAPLFLNLFSLNPGEGLYVAPGTLHSYLEGNGVELMASSDNVLRAGLTPKHVDIAELLKITSFLPSPSSVIEPTIAEPRSPWLTYPTSTSQFKLFTNNQKMNKFSLNSVSSYGKILIVVKGNFKISDGLNHILELKRGDTLLVAAEATEVNIEGNGAFFCATKEL